MPTLSPLPSHAKVTRGLPWIQALLEAFPPTPDGLEAPRGPEQLASRQALQTMGLPGKQEEAWRFTDLSLLTDIAPRAFEPALGDPQALPSTTSNAWRFPLGSQPSANLGPWPEGIELLSGPDLEAHLGRVLRATGTDQHWSVQLNDAIFQTVVALRIRAGVSTPIEVVSDLPHGSGVQPHRLLLLLEPGASLELLEVHRASGESLSSVVLEAHLGPHSRLQHGVVSQGTDRSALLSLTAVSQERGSHYAQTSVCSGWGLVRQDPVVLQLEGQATTRLQGLHWVRGRQIADSHTRVRFAGMEGELDQVHKVVAEEQGRSVFNGCIQVPRQAQGTNASQLSRSLLLSDRARIDTKPELEIVADDVRCSHGATISRLQQDELFYLQSRGIAGPQAARLLLQGFCEEILAQLPQTARSWHPLAALLPEEGRP